MELIHISDDPCRFIVRINNLDQPIRRIFPLSRFIETLRSKEMGLVAPRLWDDPREDPTALCMLDGRHLSPPKDQQPLSAYLAPVWAQCWSLNPGSDTLLRAYSRVRIDEQTRRNIHRDEEGVIVTTTVRHLLAASEAWHADGANGHVVVGRVEYLADSEIGQRIVNACNTGELGPNFFRTVQGRADSLMWKRDYFSHEQEARLMLIARVWPDDEPVPAVRSVRIDPNVLFRSISVDPRLISFEAKEREAELREVGFNGEIHPDLSYQKVFNLLEMRRDWPAP
jgi:hypothetical protein